MPRHSDPIGPALRATIALLGCANCRYADPGGLPSGGLLCNGPLRLQIDAETGHCLSARPLLATGLRYVHRSSPGPYGPCVSPRTVNSPSKP